MAQQLVLTEEESVRKAGAIKALSLGALTAQATAQVIIIILWLLNPEFQVVSFTLVAVSAMFISLISYWLGKFGKVKTAGYFISVGFTLYTAIAVTLFWGFAGPLPIIYIFPIIIAGMVIRLKASFLIATLATLLYLIMIPVEQSGILPQIVEIAEKDTMLLSTTISLRIIFFYLVAFLSWFAASRLNQALQRTHRYASELQTAYEKLQASDEELRVSNEELRTTEEELRASNEELKTIEEELRTSNEELQTTNEELREAQEQLIRSERLAAIGQLAGGVGHELRNPLGAIKNAVYYVKGKVAKSELGQKEPRVIEFLDIADDEVNSSNKIINDLLGFSRVGEPSVSSVKIEKVIEDALSHTPIPESIELTKKLDADLPEIELDTEQIRQVLVNIITNAVQAMPEGGKLTIGAREKDKCLEVEIADTGCGIPQEVIGKIFDPLFTTRAKGIGLGLAVCRTIIERHEGHITVNSKVGEGTTFTIKLLLTRE